MANEFGCCSYNLFRTCWTAAQVFKKKFIFEKFYNKKVFRGQESAGIVTCKWNHEPLSQHRGMGLVSQVFNEAIMMQLKGNLGIGHSRYSTMGGSDNPALSQPFIVHTSYGTLSVAHNGELVNSSRLRQRILSIGVGLSTGSDTELVCLLLSFIVNSNNLNLNYFLDHTSIEYGTTATVSSKFH